MPRSHGSGLSGRTSPPSRPVWSSGLQQRPLTRPGTFGVASPTPRWRSAAVRVAAGRQRTGRCLRHERHRHERVATPCTGGRAGSLPPHLLTRRPPRARAGRPSARQARHPRGSGDPDLSARGGPPSQQHMGVGPRRTPGTGDPYRPQDTREAVDHRRHRPRHEDADGLGDHVRSSHRGLRSSGTDHGRDRALFTDGGLHRRRAPLRRVGRGAGVPGGLGHRSFHDSAPHRAGGASGPSRPRSGQGRRLGDCVTRLVYEGIHVLESEGLCHDHATSDRSSPNV